MKASTLALILMTAAGPVFLLDCGSSNSGSNPGTGGSDEETGGAGGKSATGGKSGTGGKAGTGGSGGATGGASGGGGSSDTGGAGGTAGTTGGSGGADTGGAGGAGTGGSVATGGSGGSTGGSGGAGGGSAVACGMGRIVPTSPILDNFDGMKQVQAWEQAFAGSQSMPLMPMGSLKVTVLGTQTYADGLLAAWANMNRACMDGSKYMGIQFNATGTVTSLFFRVGTAGTYPVSEGGVCTSATTCAYAHYQKNVTAGLNGPAPIKVAFSELTPPFGTPPPFDKSSLITIIFLTEDMNKAHSFTIDNISFY